MSKLARLINQSPDQLVDERIRSFLYHPQDWLFVSRGQPERPLNARNVQWTFKKAQTCGLCIGRWFHKIDQMLVPTHRLCRVWHERALPF